MAFCTQRRAIRLEWQGFGAAAGAVPPPAPLLPLSKLGVIMPSLSDAAACCGRRLLSGGPSELLPPDASSPPAPPPVLAPINDGSFVASGFAVAAAAADPATPFALAELPLLSVPVAAPAAYPAIVPLDRRRLNARALVVAVEFSFPLLGEPAVVVAVLAMVSSRCNVCPRQGKGRVTSAVSSVYVLRSGISVLLLGRPTHHVFFMFAKKDTPEKDRSKQATTTNTQER